jgi:HAD superfamily hydrolase (TIGR01509 family)
MIRALLFDFDGTILDTEICDYEAWRAVFQSYGFDLPLEMWLPGFHGAIEKFDPHRELENRLGYSLQRHAIRHQHETLEAACVARQPLRPGVAEYLQQAGLRGIKVGVVSSETRVWITGHLDRLGLADSFDTILSADNSRRLKPEPDLYLLALERLEVLPSQAVAIEDSPNGILAARRAGLYCVAVPNPITSQFDLSQASLQVASLADLPFEQLSHLMETIPS